VLLLLLLLPVTFGLSGCEDEYYGARPGYGPYYGGGYDPVTLVALAMALTQALSRSRLVIGPI